MKVALTSRPKRQSYTGKSSFAISQFSFRNMQKSFYFSTNLCFLFSNSCDLLPGVQYTSDYTSGKSCNHYRNPNILFSIPSGLRNSNNYRDKKNRYTVCIFLRGLIEKQSTVKLALCQPEKCQPRRSAVVNLNPKPRKAPNFYYIAVTLKSAIFWKRLRFLL